MSGKDISTLYHYCSLSNFLSIIKSKKIRLSDINKSNDYLETKAVLRFIKEAAINIYKKSPISDSDVIIYGMRNQDAFQYVLDVVFNKILKNDDSLVYVACFSEEKDLLSQWRGYSDNGKGVAIGFSLNCLIKICESTNMLTIRKVEYTNCKSNSYNALVTKYADKIVEDIFRALSSKKSKELLINSYSYDIFSRLTQQCLIRDSIFIKHQSFSEENEWRMVLDDELSKESNEWDMLYNWSEHKVFPGGLQFRSTGNDIISYLDLCFDDLKEEIISTIVIGPNCKLQTDDARQLLQRFGYELDDENIILSDSTYRV